MYWQWKLIQMQQGIGSWRRMWNQQSLQGILYPTLGWKAEMFYDEYSSWKQM